MGKIEQIAFSDLLEATSLEGWLNLNPYQHIS